MNCQICGAPLEANAHAGADRCIYCDASQLLAGEGNGLDGVVFLGSPTDLDCPTCGDQLVTGLLEDNAVRACPGCFGVAISKSTFSRLVAERRTSDHGPKRRPQPVRSSDLQRACECPVCRESMNVHPYHGPASSVIETCPDCRLVWIDSGEFAPLESASARR